MAKYHHTPQLSGWIGIKDFLNRPLAYVDCRQGGAQQAYADLCRDFERAGWQLSDRKYDWQVMRRSGVQWEIRIGILAPGGQVRGIYG